MMLCFTPTTSSMCTGILWTARLNCANFEWSWKYRRSACLRLSDLCFCYSLFANAMLISLRRFHAWLLLLTACLTIIFDWAWQSFHRRRTWLAVSVPAYRLVEQQFASSNEVIAHRYLTYRYPTTLSPSIWSIFHSSFDLESQVYK